MKKMIRPIHCLWFILISLLTNVLHAQPAVTSFTPSGGIPGTAVTITGTNFNASAANNIVFFGATRAAIVSASATSLTATVPFGATYQPLSVLNTDTHLTGFGSKAFVTSFSNAAGPAIGSDFYTSRSELSTAALPYFVTAGDLDGDGRSELVVVNANANSVSIFPNTSTSGPSFGSRVDITTGDSPLSVAIGDVDGDGKPDLVVVNERNASVSVYRNMSTSGQLTAASFASPVSFSVGEHPYSVALADLDRDGRTDIITANSQSNTISLLRNTSTAGSVDAGSFASRLDLATGVNPRFVSAGDLDGDGKPEIAVVNQLSNTVSVLLNTSTSGVLEASSFSTKVDFMTGAGPIGVAIGDIDLDGKPELAVANVSANTISVFRNTFTAGTIDASSFAARTDFATTAQPFGLALGDINGDGRPDIAIPNSVSNGLSVLRNMSTTGSINAGSFGANVQFATGGYPLSVAIADLDNDGVPEAITSNGANTITVLKATLPGKPFISSISPASGAAGTTVTINGGYFNPVPASNTVYFGAARATVTGGSSTSLVVTVPAGTTYQPVSVLNNTSGFTAYYTNPFNLTFANPSGSGIGAGYYLPKVDIGPGSGGSNSVALGDLDGDGKTDMVVANTTGRSISIFRNISVTGSISTSSFAQKVDVIMPSRPGTVGISDLDGDGKPDIVVLNATSPTSLTGQFSFLHNISSPGSLTTTSFEARVDLPLDQITPNSVAIADFDGDGKPDIAYITYIAAVNYGVGILRNISTRGSITAASFTGIGVFEAKYASSVAAADIDGDAKPDLIVGRYYDTSVAVFRNRTPLGSSEIAFNSGVVALSGFEPQFISVGDLDGDGRPDLVASHQPFRSTSVSVTRNLSTVGVLSFSPRFELPVSSDLNAAAIADADGDGKPDILVANPASNTVSVIRNVSTTGSLTATSFASRVDFPTGANPVNLTAGDLDGDGIPEVVTVNYNDNTVSLLKTAGIPAAPRITSFSPVSGPVGTTVTITGSNFNTTAAGNTVYFGAVKAAVSAGTTTSLTVTVPAGATYQPLSVTNQVNGLTAYANRAYARTFTNPFGSGIPANFYNPRVDFTTGTLPYTMAFGDLDGDGLSDAVVVNASSNTVSVLRNTAGNRIISANSFGVKTDFATGSQPRAVAIADIDGDGKLDVIVTNSDAGTVSVFRNTSVQGTFNSTSLSAGIQFPVGDHPYSVAVSDLDGDGKPEIVTANLFSGNVSVLRNIGISGSLTASSFSAKTDLAAGSNPRFVALGDLDGDGQTDIAVVNELSGTVSVIRNLYSSGTLDASSFASKVDFTVGSHPLGITIGDIDGDGKPELSVVNSASNSVSVLQNTSTAGIDASSFTTPVELATGASPFALAIGDADGDGKADLITINAGSSDLSVLRNSSVGGSITAASFSITNFATGGYPVYVAIADLNGDGIAELASANAAGNSISVLEVFRTTTVAAPPTITSLSPAAAPLGASVVISGTNFNAVATNNAVYFGAVKATVTGGSSNSLNVTVPAGVSAKPVSVLNTPEGLSAVSQKGPFDLTFANPFGSGIPSNFYTPLTTVLMDSRFPYSEALGDVDGDGKPDLAVANMNGHTVAVMHNNFGTAPGAAFGPIVLFTTEGNNTTVLFSDVDGDGKPDLLALNINTSSISIFRNISTTPGVISSSSFAPAVNIHLKAQASPYSMAAGDIDGDGRPDLAVANSAAGVGISVLRNTAVPGNIDASSFGTEITFPVDAINAQPKAVALNDIDGDGKVDMLVVNEQSKTLSIFRNSATAGAITAASFPSRADYATGNDPVSLAVGDLNGDGRPDIVVANSIGSYTLSVFQNTSVPGSITSASLAPKVDFPTGPQVNMVIITDADGDGKPDLAECNYASNTLSVIRNVAGTGSITASFFAPRVDFTVQTLPPSLIAGDVDGDGVTELLSGHANTGNIVILHVNKPAALTTSQPEVRTVETPEQPAGHVQVYPNPSNGDFTLQLSGLNTGSATVEIVSENGRVIERRMLSLNNKASSVIQRLSLRSQPAGVYYVKLISTSGIRIQKLVLQR